jgi:hypothetical protein
MPALKDPAVVRSHLEAHMARIPWLRGTGPNPFEYYQWDARSVELLTALYGEESDELNQYHAAAGTRGRLPGVRGQAENMTLNIHGPWGILSRLGRAETVFAALLASIPA